MTDIHQLKVVRHNRPSPILCRLGRHKWSKEARGINTGIGTVTRCERLCGERNLSFSRPVVLDSGQKFTASFDDPWYDTEVSDYKRKYNVE
jgi:hypothetical protein